MNGCGYCIYMHVREAVKNGEDDMRIHMLDAWRHSAVHPPRTRVPYLD